MPSAEAELTALRNRVVELEAALEKSTAKIDNLTIDLRHANATTRKATIEAKIGAAAREAGVLPLAVKDVVLHAVVENKWDIDSQGRLVCMVEPGVAAVDTAGNYVTPAGWVKALRETAPYFFGVDQTESTSTAQASSTAKNPWTAEHWSITEQGRQCAVDMKRAKKMAEAAGSRIGATKPPAPRS